MSPLSHDSLFVPHGFFGRQGGVSKPPYDTLNAGLLSGDDKDAVAENRARIRTALGADYLVSLKQVHSDRVIIAKDKPVSDEESDGIVTNVPGLALGILTADCGPVLLLDQDAGIIGACHAGWRGALAGIVENTIAAMCELGASPSQMSAVLGPCIGPDSYEVGDDFKSEFLDISADYDQFFVHGASNKPYFNLPAFILSRLKACDVAVSAWTGQDTYAETDAYFSYRRNTHEGLSGYGRNLSAIMLPS
jgi:YfiH family protein